MLALEERFMLRELYRKGVSISEIARGTGRSRASSRPSSESTGGDGDHAGGTGDFDVVARGRRFVARALQPHVVAHIAEGLTVEDKLGGPAFEVDSGGDACRASNDDH